MRPKPYIGVSGFKQYGQVKKLTQELERHLSRQAAAKSRLMVGVLVSDTTLRGESNKYPFRYPAPNTVSRIFSREYDSLNLIHYASDDPARLFESLPVVRELGGPCCDGMQLNMPWPDPAALRKHRERWPNDTMVIQCGKEACRQEGHQPEAIIRRATCDYGELATHVLIDLSGGTGEPLDVAFTQSCLEWFGVLAPATMGAVIAGGLCAETLPLVEPLIRTYRCSIDAESGLRYEDDCFHQVKARDYVCAAAPYYL